MAKTVIGVQLYTVREFMKTPADIAATFKKLGKIGYRAVQLSALGPIEPMELKKIADGEGIQIAATHLSFERMRDDPQGVIDEHQLWDCKYTAIGGLPEEYRNAEGYPRFAREATDVAKRLAEGGLVFGYHNHSFELQRFGDRTGLQILYEDSDPNYFTAEIDTYWIQHGGGDPAEWVRRVKGRSPLLHLKDMGVGPDGPEMAEVGEGNLNWPAILDAARDAGVVWYLVEQDTCRGDPFDSLKISLDNMQKWGL